MDIEKREYWESATQKQASLQSSWIDVVGQQTSISYSLKEMEQNSPHRKILRDQPC